MDSILDDCNTVTQIVVPKPLRNEIVHLAHDDWFAGHLGENKMYDCMLYCFLWQGLKRNVKQYCKTCHTCQVCGKSNETVPPYPLYERVIVDWAGPLPRTKAGQKFLLTMMCAIARFPEAILPCKITMATILKAFFPVFGLLKVVQADQGTNFMSQVFAQVIKQLTITQMHVTLTAICGPSVSTFEPSLGKNNFAT